MMLAPLPAALLPAFLDPTFFLFSVEDVFGFLAPCLWADAELIAAVLIL